MRPWQRDSMAVMGVLCLLGFAFFVWPPLVLGVGAVVLLSAWLWIIPDEEKPDGS